MAPAVFEVVVIAGLLSLALLPLWRRLPSLGSRIVGLAGVGLVALAAAALLAGARPSRAAFRSVPRQVDDGGFTSSQTCRACHPGEYHSWYRSFHRTMTQVASPQSVIPPWDGVEIATRHGRYRLTREGDEFFAEIDDPVWSERLKRGIYGDARPATEDRFQETLRRRRIVMTTGSHHYQAFWVPRDDGAAVELCQFPLVYLLDERRWIPSEDAFIRPDTPDRRSPFWSNNCIVCHSTGGQPGLYTADTRVAELGIACESCHGPAEAHVAANHDPLRRWRLAASDRGDPTIVNPRRVSFKVSAEICGQCHSFYVELNAKQIKERGFAFRAGQSLAPERYPLRIDEERLTDEVAEYTFWPDGTVRVGGREYNGLIESPCYQRGELSCISCHSIHQGEPDDQLTAEMRGNQGCLNCHADIGRRLADHTRHPPQSSGSLCYNCHMPRTTYALFKAIMSHRIDSPRAGDSVAYGRPNACNLCHLDRSLAWTAEHLHQWYGQEPPDLTDDQRRYSAAVLWLLSGDAAQRALVAWHLGWAEAQAASGTAWMAPALSPLLLDPYAAIRLIAGRALASLPGLATLEYDFLATQDERVAAVAQAVELWHRQRQAHPEPPCPAALVTGPAAYDSETMQRLLGERDDRTIMIFE